jgi:hypothetical protein
MTRITGCQENGFCVYGQLMIHAIALSTLNNEFLMIIKNLYLEQLSKKNKVHDSICFENN